MGFSIREGAEYLLEISQGDWAPLVLQPSGAKLLVCSENAQQFIFFAFCFG
jgi:hypothetical protein